MYSVVNKFCTAGRKLTKLRSSKFRIIVTACLHSLMPLAFLRTNGHHFVVSFRVFFSVPKTFFLFVYFLFICRPIKMICGLSRETVVGLVANLESRLIRQTEYVGRKIPPEHPRSSSTNDVEGFFSLLHEMFGPVFDLKQFYDECPKILQEFKKRIDVDPPVFLLDWYKTKVHGL